MHEGGGRGTDRAGRAGGELISAKTRETRFAGASEQSRNILIPAAGQTEREGSREGEFRQYFNQLDR